MNIYEATKLAAEKATTMYRASLPDFHVQPTNSPECCIVSMPQFKAAPRWNPKLDDLVAEDWLVKE